MAASLAVLSRRPDAAWTANDVSTSSLSNMGRKTSHHYASIERARATRP
jgi:hypothetical protein